VICNRKALEMTVRRYVDELCLPSSLAEFIIRNFSGTRLFTMTTEIPNYECSDSRWLRTSLPSVAARALALILISLKFHFGLDDDQEYYHSALAQLQNRNKTTETTENDEEKNEEKYFDILDWIRLSKLRIDHLISNDFAAREQYRTFRDNGTPIETVQSMDEARVMFEQVKRAKRLKDDHKFGPLNELLEEYASNSEFELKRAATDSIKLLQHKTGILLNETKSSQLSSHIDNLLNMRKLRLRPENRPRSEDTAKLSTGTIQEVKTKINHRRYASNPQTVARFFREKVTCRKVKDSGVKPKKTASQLDRDTRRLKKYVFAIATTPRYWFAPHIRSPAAQSNELWHKLVFQHRQSEQHFLSYMTTLSPDNYVWILRYFSAYALLPLILLEEEVMNVEMYINNLDEDFFGHKKIKFPRLTAAGIIAFKNRQAPCIKRRTFCCCNECNLTYKKFPRENKHVT